jgi:molybdopterin molybdotransferase
MLCFEWYVRPALRKLLGLPCLFRPQASAMLAEDYRKGAQDRRTHWLRVRVRETSEGWVATSTGPQGSGILSSMTKSNAIAEIPASSGSMKAGDTVTVHFTDLPEDH